MAKQRKLSVKPTPTIDDVRRAVKELRVGDVELMLAGKSGLALLPFCRFIPSGGLEGLRALTEDSSNSAGLTRLFVRTMTHALRSNGLNPGIVRLKKLLPPEMVEDLFGALLYGRIIAKALIFEYNDKDMTPLRSIGLQLGYAGPWPENFPSPDRLPVLNPAPSPEDINTVEVACGYSKFILTDGQGDWIARRVAPNPHPGDVWRVASLVANRHYDVPSDDQSDTAILIPKKRLRQAQSYLRRLDRALYLDEAKLCVAVSLQVWPNQQPIIQAVEVQSSFLAEVANNIDFTVHPLDHKDLKRIRSDVATFQSKITSSFEERLAAWRTRVSAVSDGYSSSQRLTLNANLGKSFEKLRDENNFAPSTFANVAFGFDRFLDTALNKAVNAVNAQVGAIRLREQAGLDNYPTLFPEARRIERKIIAHLGPTNSGKTHSAMLALTSAETGAYLAPLRLMALEGYDRITAAGVNCAMLTGEEQIKPAGATHVSATIEMCNLSRVIDVAVVDESHLIEDRDRGWAWTQALVGVPAREVHITGSQDALPYISKIAEMCGDHLEIITYSRKVPLDTIKAPLTLHDIKPGDALIAFSRKDVLTLREQILRAGHSVATIYGALGPEIRRTEADRFRTGDAEIMVVR